MDGTIRSHETKQVLTDVLARRKVPAAVYAFRAGALHLMIGSRVAEFSTKAGLGYYALQDLVGRLEMAITEYEMAKARRNQVDLEDLIREKADA